MILHCHFIFSAHNTRNVHRYELLLQMSVL